MTMYTDIDMTVRMGTDIDTDMNWSTWIGAWIYIHVGIVMETQVYMSIATAIEMDEDGDGYDYDHDGAKDEEGVTRRSPGDEPSYR